MVAYPARGGWTKNDSSIFTTWVCREENLLLTLITPLITPLITLNHAGVFLHSLPVRLAFCRLFQFFSVFAATASLAHATARNERRPRVARGPWVVRPVHLHQGRLQQGRLRRQDRRLCFCTFSGATSSSAPPCQPRAGGRSRAFPAPIDNQCAALVFVRVPHRTGGAARSLAREALCPSP